MERPHQRPRLSLSVPLPADEVAQKISDALLRPEARCEGSVTPRHAWLHVHPEDRHFWSPTLDLMILESGEDRAQTELKGRFAPHPSIWTAFLFIYAVLGLGAVLGVMFAVAQLAMGDAPWALAGSAAGLALIGFVYGATLIGQGLGAEQMTEIRLFLDRVLFPCPPDVEPGSASPAPSGPPTTAT